MGTYNIRSMKDSEEELVEQLVKYGMEILEI